jgi:hypothetical protein
LSSGSFSSWIASWFLPLDNILHLKLVNKSNGVHCFCELS